jgi:deoxycytidylate deaminase
MYSTNLLRAIELAKTNPIKPLGRNNISRFACVLDNSWVQHTGFNSYKTHPLQKKFGSNSESIHIHAELDAIIKAIRWEASQAGARYKDITDLSKYRLSVARVLNDGTPSIAKPCSGCLKAIASFNIKEMEWTT